MWVQTIEKLEIQNREQNFEFLYGQESSTEQTAKLLSTQAGVNQKMKGNEDMVVCSGAFGGVLVENMICSPSVLLGITPRL